VTQWGRGISPWQVLRSCMAIPGEFDGLSQGRFLALAAPKCDLPGGHMVPRAPSPVKSAHTKCMREDKVPLCDRHHLSMRPEQNPFSPTMAFKCVSHGCRRYYGRRYGYFDLSGSMPLSPEQIDPASRCMKACPVRRTHSFMAITRPKNRAPDAKHLWCWHCYECNKLR
jgi:hypothetical protein